MRKSERLDKQKDVSIIEIKVTSWNKDSHGLFDYESKNYISQDIKKLPADWLLYRSKENSLVSIHDIRTYKDQDLGDSNFLTRIFSQKHSDGMKYFIGNIENSVTKKNSEQMMTQGSISDQVGKDEPYMIVQSIKNPDNDGTGDVLGIGQCIKMGRVEYSIIEMKTQGLREVSETSNFSFFKNQSKLQNMDEEIEEGAMCKVCMEGVQQQEDNFLLSPCKCSGSCKYIHLGCLKNWMLSKVRKEIIGGTAYYHFDKFQCQICRNPLPKMIVRGQKSYELLSVERPQGSYLILQELGENKKDLIVIKNISEQGISIGRGHQCEIRINDISVSRQHAQIILRDGQFRILDKGSKFGTLIKLTSSVPIDNQKRSLQIGRTVLAFSMRKEKRSLLTKQIENCLNEPVPILRQKSK